MVGKWFGFEREEVFEEGVSNFELGDFEEASKAFEACLAEDSSDMRFRSHLMICYERMATSAFQDEDYHAAAAMVESALVLNPARPDLHLMAAKVFRSMRKLALANFHMTRAGKYAPISSEPA